MIGLMLMALQQAPTEPGEMAVHVREALLKERASFLSPTVERLPEGSILEVVEIQGGWGRVERGDRSLWVHLSAVTPKREYHPLEGTDAASQTEGTFISTKGFNPAAEAERRSRGDMERWYRVVDRIETTPAWTRSIEDAARVVEEFRRSRGLEP